MSRFLLATWDGGGTIPPELGLAAELIGRGHEVVVLSDDTVEREAVDAGATFIPWQRAPQARARDTERALIRDWEVRNPLAQVRQVGRAALLRARVAPRRRPGRCHRRATHPTC